MPVFVYQTFEIKQDKLLEGIENLQEIKKYRNEHFDHTVEILAPITGQDYTYGLLLTFEGLAEMELQNKKMLNEEEYIKLFNQFLQENIVQGRMTSQLYRSMSDIKKEKEK